VDPRSGDRGEVNDGVGAGKAFDRLSELCQIREQRRRDQVDGDDLMSVFLEIAGDSPAGLAARTGHDDLHSGEAYEESRPRDIVAGPVTPYPLSSFAAAVAAASSGVRRMTCSQPWNRAGSCTMT